MLAARTAGHNYGSQIALSAELKDFIKTISKHVLRVWISFGVVFLQRNDQIAAAIITIVTLLAGWWFSATMQDLANSEDLASRYHAIGTEVAESFNKCNEMHVSFQNLVDGIYRHEEISSQITKTETDAWDQARADPQFTQDIQKRVDKVGNVPVSVFTPDPTGRPININVSAMPGPTDQDLDKSLNAQYHGISHINHLIDNFNLENATGFGAKSNDDRLREATASMNDVVNECQDELIPRAIALPPELKRFEQEESMASVNFRLQLGAIVFLLIFIVASVIVWNRNSKPEVDHAG